MKIRNIIIIVLSLIGISLIALACTALGPVIVGSSQVETRYFDVKDFTNVEVSSAFKVKISQADSHYLSITANQNLFDYLVVTDDNGTLKIYVKPLHIFSSMTEEAQITLSNLHSLTLSGACRGEVSGFKALSDLDLEVSGASKIVLADIGVSLARFTVSGASTITGTVTVVTGDFNILGASTIELTGSANEVNILGSGASSVRLADFPTNKAKFNLSGASNGTTDVSDKLDIILSGASRLVYSGHPELGSISVSGASNINHQ
jgi:hypothetical protein